MFKEFWEFINRGNVMDLAVAVIIGAAFIAIVDSLVGDIITPALLNPTMQVAGVDRLESLTWNGIVYGTFLAAVINFFLIVLVLFLVVRAINRAREHIISSAEEEIAAEPSEDVALLQEIRDLLKERNSV